MTNAGKSLLKNASQNLVATKQESENLNPRPGLIQRLKRGKEARTQFVSSHVDKGIAFQIRALRDKQDLSQEDLSRMVGMNQNAISRLESPQYGRPTITTLKRLAAAFDVALIVRFVPFSQLVDWVSGTPHLDWGLSSTSLRVPNFDEEAAALKAGQDYLAYEGGEQEPSFFISVPKVGLLNVSTDLAFQSDEIQPLVETSTSLQPIGFRQLGAANSTTYSVLS
jgi:transcriptional regulator with XRE-family HTH domain